MGSQREKTRWKFRQLREKIKRREYPTAATEIYFTEIRMQPALALLSQCTAFASYEKDVGACLNPGCDKHEQLKQIGIFPV